MKKQLLAVLTIVSAGFVAGCGGGGSTTPTASVAGKVADGYLVGATVFMDKNGNYQVDQGEPSATTDQNGAYTLTNVDAADVGKYPIVAIATQGKTTDMDTGLAVSQSYVLSMPATAVSGTVSSSNFISPMSSQLREMMETGKYATMQQAMSDLRTKLGMPAGTDMMTDYVASKNTAMHAAAQNMASLMGSQMSQVLSTSGTSTTVDVNRYRGMMGTIFSNISSITGPNAPSAMSSLMSSMTTNLTNITVGQPFRNMSTAFRGGMMGGTNTMATTTSTTTPATISTTTPTTSPTTTPTTPPMTPPTTMMPSFNALAYYNTTCLGCHGSLGVRSAAQIQAAMNSNMGGTGSMNLTSAQIAAIAAVSH